MDADRKPGWWACTSKKRVGVWWNHKNRNTEREGDGSRGGERSRLSRAGNEDDKREEEGEEAVMRGGVGQRSSCDMEAVGSEEVWVEVSEMSYASLRRRRQGDKCPLLFFWLFSPQTLGKERTSRCLLTTKRLFLFRHLLFARTNLIWCISLCVHASVRRGVCEH